MGQARAAWPPLTTDGRRPDPSSKPLRWAWGWWTRPAIVMSLDRAQRMGFSNPTTTASRGATDLSCSRVLRRASRGSAGCAALSRPTALLDRLQLAVAPLVIGEGRRSLSLPASPPWVTVCVRTAESYAWARTSSSIARPGLTTVGQGALSRAGEEHSSRMPASVSASPVRPWPHRSKAVGS
jgi:hypothetical protein